MKIKIDDVEVEADLIPELFVAYVAAMRAQHYAEGDVAKGAEKDFAVPFHFEYRYACTHSEEIKEWLGNSIDLPNIDPNRVIPIL